MRSKSPSPWSIGIYAGDSPFNLRPAPGVRHPVLTSADVTDVPAAFVADPFMLRVSGVWHMFFEVLNKETGDGEIGLATSDDGLGWRYRQIVLKEPFHLSYPYVFAWKGEYYMVPETLGARSIRLYRATDFPLRWSPVASLVEGMHADPSVFRFNARWWMFACSTPYQHDTLRLYSARTLLGPWREHPSSPVVEGDKQTARPGGRVLILGDRIIRFTQDCYPSYGRQVRAFEVLELTPTLYREEEIPESPVLTAGRGWNRAGMHHIDPYATADGRWIACVDGHV